MPQQNLISLNIPEADIADIKNAVTVLKTKLFPKLETLTTDERMELPKMGDKTTEFVRKTYDYCVKNPEFIPPFMDVNEFKIDVDAIEVLRPFYIDIIQVAEAVDDTMLLSGSEAYQAALMYYNSVKQGAKTGIANAETIYKDLAVRFPAKNIKAKTQVTGS